MSPKILLLTAFGMAGVAAIATVAFSLLENQAGATIGLVVLLLSIGALLFVQGRRSASALLRVLKRLDAVLLTQRTLERRVNELLSQQADSYSRLSESLNTTLESIKSAERRLVALAERARITAEKQETIVVQGLSTNTHQIDKLVRSSKIETVNEIEALLQILPLVRPQSLLPATGNWALDARSLAELIQLVSSEAPARVLELGSGTSTIWLGYLLKKYGGKMVSVDHDEYYLARTRTEITKHGLANTVETRLAPISPGSWALDAERWYDKFAFTDIPEIDLLLVDGPPKKTGPFARVPALYELYDRVAPGGLIILDDSHRPDESRILEDWIKNFDLEVVDNHAGSLTILRKPAT